MKKAVPIITVILTVFLFAACGRMEAQQPTQPPAIQQQAPITQAPELPELPEEAPPLVDAHADVDPDLKAFLDSYEEFIDQYVAFMKDYSDSSDMVGMMGDYMKMLGQYAEFEAALAKYDTDSMSDADALYYSEVCLRCSQKLLAVVG